MQRLAGILKIAGAVLCAAFLIHGTAFYYLQRSEIRNVGRMRAAHAGELTALRGKLDEKAKELVAVAREESLLRERLNTLIDECRAMPDLEFLNSLAEGRLKGVNSLDDDAYLASVYRGRPVIVEDLPVDDFFIRPGSETATLKFPPERRVSRAAFPLGRPENAPLRALDRKARHRVSFVGRVQEWSGQFEIVEARLLGLQSGGR